LPYGKPERQCDISLGPTSPPRTLAELRDMFGFCEPATLRFQGEPSSSFRSWVDQCDPSWARSRAGSASIPYPVCGRSCAAGRDAPELRALFSVADNEPVPWAVECLAGRSGKSSCPGLTHAVNQHHEEQIVTWEFDAGAFTTPVACASGRPVYLRVSSTRFGRDPAAPIAECSPE